MPDAIELTVQLAAPADNALAEHPEIDEPASSKLTVPVAKVPPSSVTEAVNVVDVPAFCGDAGEAVNVVVEAAAASVTAVGEELIDL